MRTRVGGLTARSRSTVTDLRVQSHNTIEELLVRSNRTVERVADLLGRRSPARLTVATGFICCLGLAAFAQTHTATAGLVAAVDPIAAQSQLVQRAQAEHASRAADRQAPVVAAQAAPATAAPAAPNAQANPDLAAPQQPPAQPAAGDAAAAAQPAAAQPPAPQAPAQAAPVAGLSQEQMDNAKAIVDAGRQLGMPRRGLIIAVATAMQESQLLNLASEVLPESKNYPHQGTGWDHDSVGLFQQRTSAGWGPVANLMDPTYAATKFYQALAQVPGWDQMALTDAAQAVQVSGFPGHYAKHEGRATEVVGALGG